MPKSRRMKLFILTLLLFTYSISLPALVEKTIHVEGEMGDKTWMSFTSSEELNLKKLFDLLSRSSTGQRLLKEARSKAALMGMTLNDVIKVGNSSLTDTTLVRKFSPHSPENVIYETRSVVYLNRHLSWDDALLDLAHELTHFVYRDSFNPYNENFNAKDFIKGTIEGQGGEVHAFLTECRVLKELFSRQSQSRSHCFKIETPEGQLSHDRAVELFYHVGPYYESFSQQLSKRDLVSAFSELKSSKINFISSAYGVPYPVAALMEYELVLNKVCENDKKRLAYMQQEPQRAPAALSLEREKFLASYAARCTSK
jgi:hypothetical protein